MTLLTMLFALVIGYVIGLAQEGVRVNINYLAPKERPPEPVQYNETHEELLPPEVQSYYTQNQGYVK